MYGGLVAEAVPSGPMHLLPWLLPLLLLAVALAALLRRRAELAAQAGHLRERAVARERGSDRARLQHPAIDLSKCIGCGACVRACPEEGVLALSYGQAVVVHGARCVGHGRCAEACPAGAIALTLGDLSDRRDLPAIDERMEATTVPGLFLAGEITGFALVRTAVQHGVQVSREIARRSRAAVGRADPGDRGGAVAVAETSVLDLAIVGAGPAGLACALAAREQGLSFQVLEQQPLLGGTVAGYPRRKLVMTQPMELPLHGRLERLEYAKEELVELWQQLAVEHDLPVALGCEVKAVRRCDDGTFVVTTQNGQWQARHVVMALGRRGSPRRLGVPGEELPKVSYGLLDAHGHAGRRVLVVGGGDSAVEAALALAEQPGAEVALSYRKPAFFRLKARNERNLQQAVAAGRLQLLLGSEVQRIEADAVVLAQHTDRGVRELTLPNDEVFVLAGGNPPFPLLEAAGVSFDPSHRPAATLPRADNLGPLLAALSAVLAGALFLVAFALWFRGYYGLPVHERPLSDWHPLLRPQGLVGLGAGLLAAMLFVANLLYLVRRAKWGDWLPGSLRGWMGAHVFTGLLSLELVTLHCGFATRDSVGGHALLVLTAVVTAGAIGRWLYAFVPRLQNGRQAELDDIGIRVAALASEWDRAGAGFAAEVRRSVEELAAAEHWRRSLPARVLGLLASQWRLLRGLRRLRQRGLGEGIPATEVGRLLVLARTAHRLTLQLSHFEELRSLLSTWRWFHRWMALLLVLLTIVHVVTALRFGQIDWSVFGFGGGS